MDCRFSATMQLIYEIVFINANIRGTFCHKTVILYLMLTCRFGEISSFE